jgi:hypothetical protein
MGIYDQERMDGKRPFLLVDGHSSRFQLPFLEYINTAAHNWSVCIGVPYGTALWQVGDSTEQNGQYKLNVTEYKRRLLKKRIDNCQQELQILPTDIIPIVNFANSKSFANVDGNKRAIAERGWFPYNRNLLLNPKIRATMTKKQIEEEKEIGLFPIVRFETDLIDGDTTRPTMMNENELRQMNTQHVPVTPPLPPLLDTPTATPPPPPSLDLNFTGTLARSVLTDIVRAHDLQEIRKEIQEKKKEGVSLTDRLKSMERMTAGNLVTTGGTHVLGQSLLAEFKERQRKKKDIEIEKARKEKNTYLKYCNEADAIFSKNISPSEWTNDQLKTVLRPLKRAKNDAAMPTTRTRLVKRWNEWRARKRRQVVGDVLLDDYSLKDIQDVLPTIQEIRRLDNAPVPAPRQILQEPEQVSVLVVEAEEVEVEDGVSACNVPVATNGTVVQVENTGTVQM